MTPKEMYQEVSEENAEELCFCNTCDESLQKGSPVVFYEDKVFCSFDKNYKCFDEFTETAYGDQIDSCMYNMEDR